MTADTPDPGCPECGLVDGHNPACASRWNAPRPVSPPSELTAKQCGVLGLCERRKGHDGQHTTSVERALAGPMYLTPEVIAEVEAQSPEWPPLDVRRVRTPEGLVIVIGPITDQAALGAAQEKGS